MHRATAWNMYRNGQLPEELEAQQINKLIYVRDFDAEEADRMYPDRIVGYAHISENEQIEDLNEQVHLLWQYAEQHDLELETIIKETGVKFGDPKPELMNILKDPSVTTLLVDNGGRISRFVVDYVDIMLRERGGRLIIIDRQDSTEKFVSDVAEVLQFLCAKIYGRAAAKDQVELALSAMDKVDVVPMGEQVYI